MTWVDFVLVAFSLSAIITGLLASHAPVDADEFDPYNESSPAPDAVESECEAGPNTTPSSWRESA